MRRSIFLLKVCLKVLFAVTSCKNVWSQRAVPATYQAGIQRSYVRLWNTTVPESVPNTLVGRPLRDVKQVTQYSDGLGKPLQAVIKQGSLVTGSTANDIVTAMEYDIFGREQFKYLPSPANNTGGNTSITDGNFKLNPFAQQATFYNSGSSTSPLFNQGETFFYGQSVFEPSPLSRMDESAVAGNNWSGSMSQPLEINRHSAKMKYLTNTVTDAVRIWNVTTGAIGSFSTYASPGTYPTGTLIKNITVDEQNKQVIEFKDKQGRLVLKKVQLTAASDDGTGSNHTGWLCTYFMYDDLNNLRCVIQPNGVNLLPSWVLTDPVILAEQCFRYEYDQRNRMIVKKVPGANETYMVYDIRDRLVMTQDANLRAAGKWMVAIYDGINRPQASGLLLNTWNNNSFIQHLNAAYSSSTYPFTLASAPSTTFWDQVTGTFYDNYDWLATNGNVFGSNRSTGEDGYFSAPDNANYPYPQPIVQSFQITGLTSGSLTKVLGTSQYLYSINYFDSKSRIIQSISYNITGAHIRTTNQYSYSGQMLTTVTFTGSNNAGAT